MTDASDPAQWARAKAATDVLVGAGLPHLVATGNHDYAASNPAGRDLTGYLATYPAVYWTGAAWFNGGMYDNNPANIWFTQTIGGKNYIFVSIEDIPRAEVCTWLEGVLAAHPNHLGIVVSHDYINQSDAVSTNGLPLREAMTAKGNCRLIGSGHVTAGQAGDRVDLQSSGARLCQFMFNWQDGVPPWSGYLRICTIKPNSRAVLHQTYSPTLNSYLETADYQFVQTW